MENKELLQLIEQTTEIFDKFWKWHEKFRKDHPDPGNVSMLLIAFKMEEYAKQILSQEGLYVKVDYVLKNEAIYGEVAQLNIVYEPTSKLIKEIEK